MSDEARVRINLHQREIEVAGSEEFVERYAERIEAMFGRLLDDKAELPSPFVEQSTTPAALIDKPDLGPFGAFLHRLPNGATEVDKMLAAGFYVEAQSSDGSFGTAEANRRLVEQGIKVGNPSQCVRQSLSAKRVFTLTKGQYKVSIEGRQHLRRLMGDAVPDA